ncbi:MAG: SulP family inorganic anion transporter, partial [Leptospiraceae bacterium]|nr:SulP family inorganic anion transporter [Leptospiraceae bacterium]
IPLASLASLLVFVGLRLSLPEMKKVSREGADNILIFGSTVYFVVFHDLLLGVGIGFLVKFILHFINVLLPKGVCVNDFFQVRLQKISETEESITYKAYGLLIYTNLLSFKFQIEKILKDKKVILDVGSLFLIDRTFSYFLKEIQSELESSKRNLEIVGLDKLSPMSNFEGSGRKLQI